MAEDTEKTVTIANTRTTFEADTIATALKDAGFAAQVVGAPTAMVWGGVGSQFAPVRVIVLEHEAAAARAALSQIRFEGQSIDWDAVDVGEPVELPFKSRWSRSRRAMWTVALLVLPPIGVTVLSIGVSRGDPSVQLMGGTVLLTSIAIVLALVWPAREVDTK